MNDLLRQSELETEILGLKVARGISVFEKLDMQPLWNEIQRKGLDMCRIKVNLKDVTLFNELDAFACPSRIFTINYQNEKLTPENPAQLPEGLSWEIFSAGQMPVLLNCLDAIYESRSWPEYIQGEFSGFVSPEAAKQLFLKFFSGFHEGNSPDSRTFFLKWNNEVAGVFMGKISADTFHGALYGILPALRAKGFSKSIYDAMDWICRENGLKYFKNEIHVLNLASQKSAQSRGLVPSEIQANITLYPLLSLKSKISMSYTGPWRDDDELLSLILNGIRSRFPDFQIKSIKKGTMKKGTKPQMPNGTLNIHRPGDSFMLAVCKIFHGTSGEFQPWYIELIR